MLLCLFCGPPLTRARLQRNIKSLDADQGRLGATRLPLSGVDDAHFIVPRGISRVSRLMSRRDRTDLPRPSSRMGSEMDCLVSEEGFLSHRPTNGLAEPSLSLPARRAVS